MRSRLLNNIKFASHCFYTKELICTVDNVNILKQVHGNNVIIINNAINIIHQDIDGDALVTDKPGIVIGIKTADCAPILFCDTEKRIIGAAHAGWKGAFAGVISNTVTAMRSLGSENIIAAIGPCIRQQNYEVDSTFYVNALNKDYESERFFCEGYKENKYQFDLPGYCASILSKLGVIVDDLCIDTYSNEQLFHSYRRKSHQTHDTITKFSNQLSIIKID